MIKIECERENLIEPRCVKKKKEEYRRIETNYTLSLLLCVLFIVVKFSRFSILLSVLLKYVRAHCVPLEFLLVLATQRRTMQDQLCLHLNAYPCCNFPATLSFFFLFLPNIESALQYSEITPASFVEIRASRLSSFSEFYSLSHYRDITLSRE